MTSEWQYVRFERLLAEPVRNGIYKAKEFHGHGARIVNMGELFAYPRLYAVPMKRLELSPSETQRFTLARGDLLFARRSLVAEGAGKCCVVLDVDPPTTFESSIIRARPDSSQADSLYLYYYFNSAGGVHALGTIRRQVAVAGITGSDLSQLVIPLPPLSEQRNIARILGALDDKIELNRRMSETLDAMARAIFKSWFIDFDAVGDKRRAGGLGHLFPTRFVDSPLGDVPEGWRVVPLPQAIDVNPPRGLSKDASAPYLDMANTPARGHTPAAVTMRPFASGMRFTNGDTLVARITPCLENGKTAYVDFLEKDQVGWGSTEFIVLRPKSPLPGEFGYCLARSDRFREFAIQSMTGSSGRQRVAPNSLSNYLLVVPPESVAQSFAKAVSPMLGRVSAAAAESRTLGALRDTLLPKLMSGELRVLQAERQVEALL